MKHLLMEIPFSMDALEPHISKETLEYHHGKHHNAYVTNLNKLIEGTRYEDMSLEAIIKESDGGIFNNAAQVYNHNFYFSGLSVQRGVASESLRSKIEEEFGSFVAFQEKFLNACATLFGSGWVWLSLKPDGGLIIEQMSNADNPLLGENKPLLTCDVWEHAYYVDYRNARPNYLTVWWGLINWDFVSKNYE